MCFPSKLLAVVCVILTTHVLKVESCAGGTRENCPTIVTTPANENNDFHWYGFEAKMDEPILFSVKTCSNAGIGFGVNGGDPDDYSFFIQIDTATNKHTQILVEAGGGQSNNFRTREVDTHDFLECDKYVDFWVVPESTNHIRLGFGHVPYMEEFFMYYNDGLVIDSFIDRFGVITGNGQEGMWCVQGVITGCDLSKIDASVYNWKNTLSGTKAKDETFTAECVTNHVDPLHPDKTTMEFTCNGEFGNILTPKCRACIPVVTTTCNDCTIDATQFENIQTPDPLQIPSNTVVEIECATNWALDDLCKKTQEVPCLCSADYNIASKISDCNVELCTTDFSDMAAHFLEPCHGDSITCFAEGTSVCVKCMDGYHYNGQVEITFECTDATSSPALPNCEAGCIVNNDQLELANIMLVSNDLTEISGTNLFSTGVGSVTLDCKPGYALGSCVDTQEATCSSSGKLTFESCCIEICAWDSVAMTAALANKKMELCDTAADSCLLKDQSVCVKCTQGYHVNGKHYFTLQCTDTGFDYDSLSTCEDSCVVSVEQLSLANIMVEGNTKLIKIPGTNLYSVGVGASLDCQAGYAFGNCQVTQGVTCTSNGDLLFESCSNMICVFDISAINTALSVKEMELCDSGANTCTLRAHSVCVKCKQGYHVNGKKLFSLQCAALGFIYDSLPTCEEVITTTCSSCTIDTAQFEHIQTPNPQQIPGNTVVGIECATNWALDDKCKTTQTVPCFCSADDDITNKISDCNVELCTTDFSGMAANFLEPCHGDSITCFAEKTSVCVKCMDGYHYNGQVEIMLDCTDATSSPALPVCEAGCAVKTDSLSEAYINTNGIGSDYIFLGNGATQTLTCADGKSLDGCVTTQNITCEQAGTVHIEQCCVKTCDWPYTSSDLDNNNLEYCIPAQAPVLNCLVTEQSVCVKCKDGYHHSTGDHIIITCDGDALSPSDIPYCNADCETPSCNIDLEQLAAAYIDVGLLPGSSSVLSPGETLDVKCIGGKSTKDCEVHQTMTCNSNGELQYQPCTNVPCCAVSQLYNMASNVRKTPLTNIQEIGNVINVSCKQWYHTATCLTKQRVTCEVDANGQGFWDGFVGCECKGKLQYSKYGCACNGGAGSYSGSPRSTSRWTVPRGYY